MEDLETLISIEDEGRLNLVSGKREIAPGITLALDGSHTPGSQYVIIETLNGPVIIAGDACYTYKNNRWHIPNRTPEYPDWLGSYYRPPRSTPTATRTEGLSAAYFLARDFADLKEAEKILEIIRLAVTFQLQTQFRPESVLYLKDPQRSLGGFHRSLDNFEIRIDYVQHNISSLLSYYRIITDKE